MMSKLLLRQCPNRQLLVFNVISSSGNTCGYINCLPGTSIVFSLSVCQSIHLCIHCRGQSNLVIIYQISKCHIWIASIKLSFKVDYGFCLMNDVQDGRIMVAAYQFALCFISYMDYFYQTHAQVKLWALSNNQ